MVDVERGRVVRGRPRPARIFAAALPLQFAFGLVYSWGAVAPFVERELHWPPVLVAAVFSATPVGYGTGIVFGGRLADRLPPRRLCWTGVGLLAAGATVALAAPSGPTFIVCYSLLGLGLGGGIALAGSVAAGRYALPGRAGTVGGVVTGAYAIAAPIQVPVVSILSAALGWLPALRLMATVMIALAATTLALMPSVPAPGAHVETGHPRVAEVAFRPRVWTGFLLEVCATPLGAYAFVAAATYARSLGATVVVATVAITAVAVGNAVGRIGGGAASDRLGVDVVVLGVLVLDIVAALLFLAGQPLVPEAALLAGVGFGVPAGVISRLAEDAAPDAPNTAFGLVFTGFAVGAGSGSLLGAALGGRLAWPALATLALAGLALGVARLRLGRRLTVLAEGDERDGQHRGEA